MSSFNWPTCWHSCKVGKNCKETVLISYTNVSRCHIIDILNYIFLFRKTNIWNCFLFSLLFLFLLLPHILWAPGGQGPCLFTALSSVIISMASTKRAHSQFLLDEYKYYSSSNILCTLSLHSHCHITSWALQSLHRIKNQGMEAKPCQHG